MISGSFKDIIQHFLANPDLIAFFLFFVGATIGLWIYPGRQIWVGFVILTLIFGFIQHKITIIGLSCITLFGVTVFGYYHWLKKPVYRLVGGTLLFVLSIGFYAHLIPGFDNPILIPAVKLSADSFIYRSFLNFDKTLAGLCFMGFGLHLARSSKDWRNAFFASLVPTFLTGALLASFALSFHYVSWDPKLPGITAIWMISNFLFVAVAEEALFRGFLQTELSKIIGGKTAKFWGLLIASLLFGLLHYKGGVFYITFATIAGLGYGIVYIITNRIEAAIIAHFLVNALHFFLFSYPALAQ